MSETVVPKDLASLTLSSSATIAQQELILARSDLKTALRALSDEERNLLAGLPKKVLALRRACRFCSVVPVMIPPVWLLFVPRMRGMWKSLRDVDARPRVKILSREFLLLGEKEQEKLVEEDPVLQGVAKTNELRDVLRFATFVPPAFMVVVAMAVHFAVFS